MKAGLITDDPLTEGSNLAIRQGTGVARYSQRLFAGLSAAGVAVEPVYVPPLGMPFDDAVKHIFRLPYSVLRKAARFDLLHGLSPIAGLCLPLTRKPNVVTYYDVIALVSKQRDAAPHVRAFAPLFLGIGRYCDKIIAVSTQTKEELVTYLNIPEHKISVIGCGVDERFRPLARGAGGERPVIGYLGALSSNKRLDYLMSALAHVVRKQPSLRARLLICGAKGRQLEELKRFAEVVNLSAEVEFMGFIPDEQLVETYNSFDVFVLPSEREGFGLPILEAQRCGVPVIIREDAHIPAEVSRCCLKAKSEEDMADKIYQLLVDERLRQAMIERGLEYSQQFTWERTVQETLRVYEEALST